MKSSLKVQFLLSSLLHHFRKALCNAAYSASLQNCCSINVLSFVEQVFFNATKNYFFKINTPFNSLLILPKRNYM
ncbi:TPA: hypothetical protein ACRO5I_004893, partial [Escherichia coli]